MLHRQIQLMSFNVYLLLFLPKNPSYKRKAGTARTEKSAVQTFLLSSKDKVF